MKHSRLTNIEVTKDQKQWLKKEKKATKESYASIIRRLIQEKVEEQ